MRRFYLTSPDETLAAGLRELGLHQVATVDPTNIETAREALRAVSGSHYIIFPNRTRADQVLLGFAIRGGSSTLILSSDPDVWDQLSTQIWGDHSPGHRVNAVVATREELIALVRKEELTR